MNLPPDSFYYALTVIFGGALIWIIKVYISKQDSILNQMSQTVIDLKIMVAKHEEKHETTDRRLDNIENGKNGNGNGKKK